MKRKKPENPWKTKILTHKQFHDAYVYCWKAASRVSRSQSEDAFIFAARRHFRNDDLTASFLIRHSALLRLSKCDLLGPYSVAIDGRKLWIHDAALAVAAYMPLERGEFDSSAFVEGLNLASQTISDTPPDRG